MKLIYVKLKSLVETGDIVVSSGDETWVVSDPVGRAPMSEASTGRVYVEQADVSGPYTREFFPSVFDMKWVD